MEELDLLSMVLPEGILDYFKIVKSEKGKTLLEIWLEEKPAKSIDSIPVHSNGFYKSIIVKDFPIRSKPVHLHIRRRRWVDVVTNKSILRNWDLVASGSRMTVEFATFLKGVPR